MIPTPIRSTTILSDFSIDCHFVASIKPYDKYSIGIAKYNLIFDQVLETNKR